MYTYENVSESRNEIPSKLTIFHFSSDQLNEMDTNFDLSPDQLKQWNKIQKYYTYVRNEYHRIHQLIWRPAPMAKSVMESGVRLPIHYYKSVGKAPDSCRFHGTITVNKVAGNFHISAGKYLPLPVGHAHISMMGGHNGKLVVVSSVMSIIYSCFAAVNFSHRIEMLSFGDRVPNIVNPLDGVEKVTHSGLFHGNIFHFHIDRVLLSTYSRPRLPVLHQGCSNGNPAHLQSPHLSVLGDRKGFRRQSRCWPPRDTGNLFEVRNRRFQSECSQELHSFLGVCGSLVCHCGRSGGHIGVHQQGDHCSLRSVHSVLVDCQVRRDELE